MFMNQFRTVSSVPTKYTFEEIFSIFAKKLTWDKSAYHIAELSSNDVSELLDLWIEKCLIKTDDYYTVKPEWSQVFY